MKLMWIRWWLFGVEPTRDEILKYCMMLIEPEKLELIPLIQPGARMEVLDAPRLQIWVEGAEDEEEWYFFVSKRRLQKSIWHGFYSAPIPVRRLESD